jgi:acetyl-CoA carboxylase carboxyltransferase component
VLEGRNISAIEDSDEKSAYITQKEDEYTKKFANPYEAAKYGFIDDVIEPRNTRFRIIRALVLLANKKEVNPPKKHSNIPL